jgi:hypothetical protein
MTSRPRSRIESLGRRLEVVLVMLLLLTTTGGLSG